MKTGIGMLIWKEMKSQDISQAKLMETLREKNVYIRDLFKIESIDVYALVQISSILKTNFFKNYEAEELAALLKFEEREREEITALKVLTKEQDKLLLTHKRMIKQQEDLIRLLKDRWPDEEG